MSRLKLISPKSSQSAQQLEQPEADAGSSSTDRTIEVQPITPEETNIYETVTTRRRKDKSHERKPSSSSSSGKSTSSIPVSVPCSDKQPSVKLRESAAQRRERRKGSGRDDAPHSSSGNWSASSESGRASIGSETTTTTHQPRYFSFFQIITNFLNSLTKKITKLTKSFQIDDNCFHWHFINIIVSYSKIQG